MCVCVLQGFICHRGKPNIQGLTLLVSLTSRLVLADKMKFLLFYSFTVALAMQPLIQKAF